MEIHFIHVKFYSIGVYLEPEVVGHLDQFKGKSAKELEDNEEFFNALISGKLWSIVALNTVKYLFNQNPYLFINWYQWTNNDIVI